MNDFMNLALKQALKAYKKQEVPIGAIIVKNGKIISKAYNKKENKQITTKHAEIIAIERACKKLKTWHLDGCEIYTTMEPCLMCYGAIEQSRISKIYYGLKNMNFGFKSKYNIETKLQVCECKISNEYIDYIKSFFKEKR
jgi:tRNA(adenine34) deaminase